MSLKKEGFKGKGLVYFGLFLLFNIVVFGKVFTILTSSKNYNFLNAGFSSYGCLIGVMVSALLFENLLQAKGKVIKYSVLSLPLIYSIGKLGCFIAGCCNGIPYKGLFYVVYPDRLNIPQFPIQIVESIVFIILFFILNKFKNKNNIVYIAAISGVLLKFLLEFLRYNHVSKILTVNQIFSIILIIGIIVFYFIKKKKNGDINE